MRTREPIREYGLGARECQVLVRDWYAGLGHEPSEAARLSKAMSLGVTEAGAARLSKAMGRSLVWGISLGVTEAMPLACLRPRALGRLPWLRP